MKNYGYGMYCVEISMQMSTFIILAFSFFSNSICKFHEKIMEELFTAAAAMLRMQIL